MTSGADRAASERPARNRGGAPKGVPKSAAHRAAIGAAIRRWSAASEPWQRRRGWRRFLSDEESALYRELRTRHGLTTVEALEAIGRADLAELRPSAPGQAEGEPRKAGN